MATERQEPLTFMQVAAQIDVVLRGKRATLLEQLDTALAEAGRHVSVRRGMKAGITLKLNLKRVGDEVKIDSLLELAEKNPEPRPLTVFADKYGVLVSDDPRQIDLPLEAVPNVAQKA